MATGVRASLKNAPVKPAKGAIGQSISSVKVIEALPQFTKQDLKAIQAAIEHELLKDSPIDKDLFYLVFDVAGEKPMSVSKFSSSENGIIWRKNQPIFDEFFNVLMGGGSAHRVILTAYKKFLVQLVVEYIKDQHMPLTIRTVSQQLGNIEVITNSAFPGYLKNGLGYLILEQFRK